MIEGKAIWPSRLIFIREAEAVTYIGKNGRKRRTRRVAVRCYCGKEFEAFLRNITDGRTQSCGCLVKETHRKHGFATDNPTEYRRWYGMIDRCYSLKNKQFHDYGGRGIRVYGPWKDDPVRWWNDIVAEIGEPKPFQQLDRIDPDGDYKPGQVRWLYPWENARNKRGRKSCRIGEVEMPLVEWAEVFNKDYAFLHHKINRTGTGTLEALIEATGPFTGTNGKHKAEAIEAAEFLVGAGDENAGPWLEKQRTLDVIYWQWVDDRRRDFFQKHPDIVAMVRAA